MSTPATVVKPAEAGERPALLMDLREAGALLGISPRCLWYWARSGRLPGTVRVGRRIMMRTRAVLEIVERGL
jgi:predicted site-specific integrase-resolvase